MAESIITVKRRQGFTVLPNSTLRDNRLSLKTRAILAIMVSMPEDWDYTVSGLAVVCGAGKDTVRSALRELETHGYLKRTQRHSETGHFSRNEYIVTDTPADEADAPLSGFPSTVKPSTAEPSTAEPLTENPTQQNKDCTNTPYSPPQGDQPPPVQKCAKCVPDWTLFERFWAAYPKKRSKERARRAWKKLNPDIELCRTMAAALERDKRSHDWLKENGEFIPYPASWLTGRRWEDAYDVEAQQRPQQPEPARPLRGEGVEYL